MGLFLTDVRLYATMLESGVRFGDVATLGRQFLLADRAACKHLLARLPVDSQRLEAFGNSTSTWADDLFPLLGATSLTSIDFSDYEGAGVVLDLNTPADPSLHQRFDTIHDGGTLEHVFNVPVALTSLMMMTRVGGHVVLNKPANNQCGHGFYQFSPEFFYRVFSEENGFAVEMMSYAEVFRGGRSDGPFYDVVDPKAAGVRVELDGGHPVNLLIVARKLRHVQPFTTPPMQSDYVAAWSSEERGQNRSRRSGLIKFGDRFAPRVMQTARTILNPLNRSGFYRRSAQPQKHP